MTNAARKSETVDVPMLDIRAAIQPASLDVEARTVTFIASTGARGLRRSWNGDYYEELDVSDTAIRMGRLQNGAPFLNSHGSWDVSDVLGVIVKAWIENAALMVTVQFSKRAYVEPIFQDIRDGILRHVSIGYRVYEYVVSEKQGELDVRRAVDWEPMEVSVVPMGFDDAAVSRSAEKQVSQAKLTYRGEGLTTEGGRIMPNVNEQENTPAVVADPGPETRGVTTEEVTRIANEAATRAAEEGARAERKRAADIRQAVTASGLGDELATRLINEGVDIHAAREQIIDAWAAAEPGDTRGIRTSTDHTVVEAMRDGAVNALLHRANPSIELTEGGKAFRHMSLVRLCEDLLQRQGVNCRGLSPMEIATRAISTSDLTNIAGSTMNRTLRQGYDSGRRTFVGVFRQGTAPDFRSMSRVNLSGAPSLLEVKENGEFTYGAVTDGKETYQLATYGRILPFTRQMIINDDMGALTRIPMMFGRAAADLESDIVWGIITANAALADTIALFHASHGNLAASGGAIDITTVSAGRAAMRVQTGLEGRLINVMPRFLITGANYETAVDQLLASITPATVAAAVPSELRSLQPVIEPRLTGNQWYLAADYNQVDTIEYSYLEGNQGVYIETEMGFEVDGIKIKARHDFAAKAIDHRGMYKNPGA
jgi:hypothetical protein